MTNNSHIEQLIQNLCPNGVKYMPLGEVCRSIFAGGTPSTRHAEYYNGDIPWLRSGEIDFNVITSTEKTITKLGFEKSSAKVVPAKSVVMAMTGATVAKVATTEIDLTANQSVCAIIPSSKLHYRYLYYYLSLNYEMLRATAQGAMSSFNLGIIRAISIPIPPLPIQEEIVRTLDAFANLIENIDKEINERERHLELTREAIFSNVETSCSEWSTLGQISKKVVSGGTPSRKVTQYFNGDIPWLRTQEIDWKDVYDTEIHITEEAVRNSAATIIPANCLIIAMYGATAGKACINRIPLTTNQACCNLVIDRNRVFYKYAYYWVCKEYLNIKGMGEGSQDNINGQKIKSYPIPLPPLAEQRAIAEKLDTIEALIANLKTERDLRQQQYEYYREHLINLLK